MTFDNPQIANLLRGKKGLVIGIANDQSIAWGCAKAFHAFGAEVAVTYLNDKALPYVEPLARQINAPLLLPLDVLKDGQLEAVFARIAESWGELDFVLHSIAFSPREALGGRVTDVEKPGFLTTMDVSCWSFIRTAHLAEPLMKNGGTLFTISFFGSQPRHIPLRVWNPPGSDFAHGAQTEALIEFERTRVQYLGTMLSHRYGFSLWIEGEKGTIWTNRKYVAWRKPGARFFRPIRNDKVPAGDERPYPQGGTTSLLNSLRDAVLNGASAPTRGDDNIWTVAMVEAGKISDQQRRTVDIAEVYRGLDAS